MTTSKPLAWLAAAFLASAAFSHSSGAAEVVKLGIILPYSGQGAQIGDGADNSHRQKADSFLWGQSTCQRWLLGMPLAQC